MNPQRMCAVCREVRDKNLLLRVVKQNGGAVLDQEGKLQGRGAYICKNDLCIQKARKARAFERSLSMRIDGAIYDALEGMILGE